MTDADLRSKLTECEDVIQQLVTKLQETIDENDRLRAELTNLAEGANAHQVLQSLYRNRDLPEALRAKAAAASLAHEVPKLLPERAALNLVADADPDAGLSLAELDEKRRKRCYEIQSLPLEIREQMVRGIALGGNGNGSDDDTPS